VADALVERAGGKWRRPASSYELARISVARAEFEVVKPLTYMNLSGEAVAALAATPRFDPNALLVVCDDTALPLGRLRLRKKGSDGGHNGLASVIEALGTERVPRLRMGVGPVPDGVDMADYVLELFSPDEEPEALSMTRSALRCIETCLTEGVDIAMTRFNTAPAGEEPPESR
jgi:PTH1 family peptidyl-tRNA hydrolase